MFRSSHLSGGDRRLLSEPLSVVSGDGGLDGQLGSARGGRADRAGDQDVERRRRPRAGRPLNVLERLRRRVKQRVELVNAIPHRHRADLAPISTPTHHSQPRMFAPIGTHFHFRSVRPDDLKTISSRLLMSTHQTRMKKYSDNKLQIQKTPVDE